MNRLRRLWPVLALTLAASAAHAQSAPAAQLAQLINGWRADNGLPAVPLSSSLTRVAEAHARDLIEHPPDAPRCNLHSWSAAASPASPCCYTPDHAQGQCMWLKPKEITGGVYPGQGFEIAYQSSQPATPEGALAGWKNSPGHNPVMINQGLWKRMTWRAMGVAVTGPVALVWFGAETDPAPPATSP